MTRYVFNNILKGSRKTLRASEMKTEPIPLNLVVICLAKIRFKLLHKHIMLVHAADNFFDRLPSVFPLRFKMLLKTYFRVTVLPR